MTEAEFLKKWIKEMRRAEEGARRVAFPGRRIRTRDEQNHALVARGRYFAFGRVAEIMEKELKK